VHDYREIIEGYSAIPCHLQQQYGLCAGHDRGRVILGGIRPADMLSAVEDVSRTGFVLDFAIDS
jgi:hypothetical protein